MPVLVIVSHATIVETSLMKGSPCCAGLMRSCLHTYRTKTNLTQHIIQPWGGASAKYGGVINQLWGGHQQSMGGSSTNYGGGISQVLGGSSTNYGGGHQPSMGGGIFPPVCTGSRNPENYFSNTYVLPSVNRTAGPTSKIAIVRELRSFSCISTRFNCSSCEGD